MISDFNIDSAQGNIANFFFQQVKNGIQSQSLNTPTDSNLLACGQFLQELDRPQRGIHGTAAALYVLAQSGNANHAITLQKLISYLRIRKRIERTLVPSQELLRDENNIIKIGEILSSLAMIQSGQAVKEAYETSLQKTLIKAKKDTNGWEYFVNSPLNSAQLLPTVFAVKGLLSVRSYDRTSIDYIYKECSDNISNGIGDYPTYAITILGIYVLAFYDYNKTYENKLKDLIINLYESTLAIFTSHNEVNLEYWFEGKNEYVRIPWQVYLIALLAKYSDRLFAKNIIQERLNEILDKSQTIGFKYPFSGAHISSRTSSIVYECLNNIKVSLKRSYAYTFYNSLDKVREFFTHKYIRFSLATIVVLCLTYTVYAYYTVTIKSLPVGSTNLDKFNSLVSSLGTEVAITVSLALLSWGRSKK